jgi:hypothetical protein
VDGRAQGDRPPVPSTETTLRRLHEALRDEGGLLWAALAGDGPGPADGDPALGALAAAGPRAAGRRDDVAFVVEAIREGYLLHYARPRLLREDDRDLVLLAGDHLYALGLARLAELGDLEAVAALADVISLSAQAHAEGRPELADAAWEAGVTAVGWDAGPELAEAKAAASSGAPGAVEKLRAAARRIMADVAPEH